MKPCQRCRAQLGEFLDGTLSASVREEVAAHLDICPDCQKELREMKADRVALREWTAVAAPADLRSRVRSTLQNEARTAPARVSPDFLGAFNFWRPQKLVWSGSLTLSAIALLLLTRTYSPTSSLQPSVPPAVEQAVESARENPTKAGDAAVSTGGGKNALPSKGADSLGKPPAPQKPLPRARVQQESQVLKPKLGSQRAQKAGDTVASNSSSAEDFAPPVTIPSPSELSERLAKEVPPPAPKARSPKVRSSRPEPMAQSAAAPQPKMRAAAPATSSRPAEASADASAMKAQVLREAPDTARIAQSRIAPRDELSFSIKISALHASSVTALENRLAPENRAAAPQVAPVPNSADNTLPPAFVPPAPIVSAPTMARKSVAVPNLDSGTRPDNAAGLQSRRGGFGDSFGGTPAAGGGRAGNEGMDSELMSRRAPRVAPPAAPHANVPGQARFRSATPEKPAVAPTQSRDFSLEIMAPRDLKNAQIRVELPPSLRFGVNDASGSRILWRGDFEAGQAVRINLSLLGGRGGEKISVFLEQNEGVAKSKTLETQMLALPESRE